MKKSLMSLMSSLLFLLIATSAADADTWAKTYGGSSSDFANAIQQTSDGGYIAAGGNSSLSAGYYDFWVLKLDGSGNVKWQQNYGGAKSDTVKSIKQTSDRGYIAVGYTESFCSWNCSGYGDAWVLKLDSTGNIEWQKTYGDSRADSAQSVQQTSDGGYIVAGYTYSIGSAHGNAWLLKLNPLGDIEWQKVYGGDVGERADVVLQTSDGGYIIGGSAGLRNGDAWILKLDSGGNIEWQMAYGGVNGESVESIYRATGGGYWVLANIAGIPWILKLESTGDIEWQKMYWKEGYGGYPSGHLTADGGFIVVSDAAGASPTGYDFWALKLDANGNIEWQRTYGGSGFDSARSVQQTSDGGYIMAGFTSSFGAVNVDAWIVKLDASGSVADCSGVIIRKADAVASNTDATAINTSAMASDTAVTPLASNAIVTDTLVAPGVVCIETAPNISVNPISLNFGSVELPASSIQSVTISNTADADLLISSINITGLNSGDFSQTNNCSTVPRSGSCVVTVIFTPTSIGLKSAALNISSNDPDTPSLNVPLTGEGIDTIPPVVTVTTNTAILWPPNHKMVDVLIGGSAGDSGSGIASVEIRVTDEYGIYNMTVPAFGHMVQLEAWREGTDKDGRHYIITAVVTDMAGNQTSGSTMVSVPHDQRN